MKLVTSRLALLAILVLFCTCGADKTAISSSTIPITAKPEEALAQESSPGGTVSWAPFKQKFTTTEGDAFLMGVDVDCPSRMPTGAEFELLPPTPSFVFKSSPFISTNVSRALILLNVNPRPGDAGKYEIKIRASTCPGQGGTGAILSFTLKVKRAL